MRCLHPSPSDTVDLADAYAYPEEPWLRANMVSSADGAATVSGSSLGMSGPADRRLLRLLRGLADVILVGAETARREPYSAAQARPEWQSLREAAGQPPAPTFAIVSGRLDLDDASALLTNAHPQARTLVLTAGSAPPDRRHRLDQAEGVAEVIIAGEHEVDPARAVDELVERGYTRLLCEGGPRLLSGIAAGGKLDELDLTLSPLLAGGGASRILGADPLTGPAPTALSLAHVLEEDGTLFLRYVRA